jgi:hypothetical protein
MIHVGGPLLISLYAPAFFGAFGFLAEKKGTVNGTSFYAPQTKIFSFFVAHAGCH